MKIKLEGKNKKDIIIAVGVALGLVVLFQFIYLPRSKEVKKLTTEYKTMKKDIDELYDFIGSRDNLEQNIIKIREEMVLLEKAFPFEKEVSDVIKQLNEKAALFKINVVSLKPKDLEIFRNREGEEVKIADYFCKSMPLTLDVESRYKDLGMFLINLEENKTPLITIKKVDIKKDEGLAPILKAEIELTAYILGK